MSIHKTPLTHFIAWSLTIALISNGPMLSAEQLVSDTTGDQISVHESIVQDVKLHAKGILTVRVVDLQGNSVVGEPVSVMFQGKEIAVAVSDENGLAAVSGLRPGLHGIVTPAGTTACRLWNSDAAPPSATSVPAIVSDAEIVRGQGDSERNKVFADAFQQDPEFFAFYRSMQAYAKGLGAAGTTLVMDPKSDFFKYFGTQKDKEQVPSTPQ